MNTVIDLSELCPRIVTDEAEIDRLRMFQLNRYFEAGLIDELPNGLPDDPHIGASTYFGIYSGDTIQATVRIIRDQGQLPMLEHHQLDPQFAERFDAVKGTVAEMSRLAVRRETPHYRAVALLAREFLHFCLKNEHATLLIASVEPPMVRILNRLIGIPVSVIGPRIDQYGSYHGACVPILIDSVEALTSFRNRQSRRWEFFMENLVIDLTDQAAPTHQLVADLRAAS
jgi:hypothetical protein